MIQYGWPYLCGWWNPPAEKKKRYVYGRPWEGGVGTLWKANMRCLCAYGGDSFCIPWLLLRSGHSHLNSIGTFDQYGWKEVSYCLLCTNKAEVRPENRHVIFLTWIIMGALLVQNTMSHPPQAAVWAGHLCSMLLFKPCHWRYHPTHLEVKVIEDWRKNTPGDVAVWKATLILCFLVD